MILAMADAKIRILDAPRCHLGEGPTYSPETDTAWWVDILERRLFEARLGSGALAAHALPWMASMIVAIDHERHLLATDDGLYVRALADSRLALHCRLEAETGRTRSNDGGVHPSGALWISTMGRAAEAGLGTIYHVRGSAVTRLYSGLTIPNAICFAPDGGTGYFADTLAGLLQRVALDAATGLPIGEPAVFHDHRGSAGCLDGAVVDSEGIVWIACWGAGCIDAYGPDGRRLRSVAVPVSRPSCPAFAGKRLDQLLVTSAFEGMSADEKRADPDHGRTLLLDLGLRGLPSPRFDLAAK